jgi:hypothetical protein
MLLLLRQSLLCRWGLHGWFLGNRGAVGAWVSCRKVDPAGGVADDGSALTDGARERLKQLDLVAARGQTGTDVGGDGLFHHDVAAIKGLLREARLLEGRLHVHVEVHDVGDELGMRLSLIPATHDAEADADVTLFHEGGNDGVQRAFVAGEGVGQAGGELEAGATILEGEAEAGGDHARAVAGVVALDEGDDVAVLVDGRQVDGRVAVLVQLGLDLRGDDLAGGLVHVNEFGALVGEVFGEALLQISSLDGVIPSRFRCQTSSGLEVERFTDERDDLRKRRGADAERAFDNARFAVDVAREVEDRRLALA